MGRFSGRYRAAQGQCQCECCITVVKLNARSNKKGGTAAPKPPLRRCSGLGGEGSFDTCAEERLVGHHRQTGAVCAGVRRRCNSCKLLGRLKFSRELLDNAYESTEKLVAPRCCSERCSLCCLCGVAPALCPAWPGPVRSTPSNPRNRRIAESPNRRGAHFDRIANREALPRDSARFGQPWWQRCCCACGCSAAS